jgi:hypothetical protein
MVAWLALTAPVTLSAAAGTGADGCGNAGPDPVSCISVSHILFQQGWVSAGVAVGIGQTVSGRFEIFRGRPGRLSLVRYSTVLTYSNRSDGHVRRFWHKFTLAQRVASGEVCARWERRTRHGFRPLPAACATLRQ